MPNKSRREFLNASLTTACSIGFSGSALSAKLISASATLRNRAKIRHALRHAPRSKKGLVFSMLPATLSIADRFKLARDAGFEVVQAPTTPDESQAAEMKKSADSSGLRIDSVMNMDHWKYPLSSSDPSIVERSLAGMRTSLRNAKLWGCDAVLLVPAVVNPETSYQDAWTRSQSQIRKLLPLAEDLKVVIAIEEVWNKFLLSPLEMNIYINEFKSPFIKSLVRRRQRRSIWLPRRIGFALSAKASSKFISGL
jgi:hexulose-6-phosphate isomerase